MFLKLQLNNQILEDFWLLAHPVSHLSKCIVKIFNQTAELKESYHEHLYTNHLDYIINLY